MKNEDDLISDLVYEGAKESLPHPFLRILPYAILLIIVIAVSACLFGIRPNYEILFSDKFLLENIFAFVVSMIALFSLGWLAIPDMRGSKIPLYSSILSFSLFLIWGIYSMLVNGVGDLGMAHLHACGAEGAFMAFVASLGAIMIIRKGYTIRPILSALSLSVFSTSMGWLALRFTCSNDDMAHYFIIHYFPFIIIGIATVAISRKIFIK